MQRRAILKAAAGAAAALGVPHLYAQAWPTGPVRIVVGFPPGGGTDALARVVGPMFANQGFAYVSINAPFILGAAAVAPAIWIAIAAGRRAQAWRAQEASRVAE